MSLGHYSPNTVRSYLSELRYLFVYFHDHDPVDFTEAMVMEYLLYLTRTLKCSRVKCKMAAQSVSFFFRHVLKKAYVIPTVIYPRPSSKIPPVMSTAEIRQLIESVVNVKHRTLIILLYSTGMRLSELSALKISDIDSKQMRIKVVQGKGAKDRYTMLSEQVLLELRSYYVIYKPKEYLFNGKTAGKPLSPRMIQYIVQRALIQLGLSSKHYTVHTIRHSFATHLMERGTDLHTIKGLLGHSSLQTTMRYMHFTTARIQGVVNPYDVLFEGGRPSAQSLEKGIL